MTQFGATRSSAREWERGWNVLKAETFLFVHSHRPYVTQPESRDGALPQPWEAEALSPPQSHSNPIMQATCLHNSAQTDRWMENGGEQQTEEQTRRPEIDHQRETHGD